MQSLLAEISDAGSCLESHGNASLGTWMPELDKISGVMLLVVQPPGPSSSLKTTSLMHLLVNIMLLLTSYH